MEEEKADGEKDMTTPAERLAALAATGFKTSDAWGGSVITDGLNAASTWASEPNIEGVTVYDYKTPSLLESYARLTGSITMRLDTFRPNPNEAVQKQRDALLAVRDRTGCRIDLACNFIGNWNPSHRKEHGVDYHLNPEGDEYTNDDQKGTYGARNPDGSHDELYGWWARCLSAAKAAGVRPRFVLFDHPPNMDAWKAGQSDELDALIMQRWRAMFELVDAMQSLACIEALINDESTVACPPHKIVYGQLFGDVLPEFRETGWLSHNGYNVNQNDRDDDAFANLVYRKRNERMCWYFKPDGRKDAFLWGREFAGCNILVSGPAHKRIEADYPKELDALCMWPCVFSTPESTEGVVSFLEGMRG